MELHRDEHFEEVLGRLDSLIRRDQPTIPPPPPPPVSEATIPVLTEVYAAAPAQAEVPLLTEIVFEREVVEVSTAEKLEQAVAAVLPVMVGVLEEALVMKIQPVMESALKQILEDLHPQIEPILRQRLQALLAQEAENQTEM